jgi:hypothetical protein
MVGLININSHPIFMTPVLDKIQIVLQNQKGIVVSSRTEYGTIVREKEAFSSDGFHKVININVEQGGS